jgi:hypothetical protein
MSRIARRAAIVVIGVLSATCLASANGFAVHPPPQGRVVPNVDFGAFVNGVSSNPVIQMGCFGAVRPGQKGHPMAGQTVEVFRPEALNVPGYTGSAATKIVARFTDDPSVGIVMRRFGRPQPIPTSLFLPCSGTGSVLFSPEPSSATARSATVTVSVAGQP